MTGTSSSKMRKSLTYSLIGLIVFLGIIVIAFDDPTITSAATYSSPTYTTCVSPAQALAYVNDKGCTRIYEDPTCTAAEIRCPQEESTVTEETPAQEEEPKTRRGGWRKRTRKHKPFYNFWQFLKWLFYRAGGKDF